jgi:hypothetical protein
VAAEDAVGAAGAFDRLQDVDGEQDFNNAEQLLNRGVSPRRGSRMRAPRLPRPKLRLPRPKLRLPRTRNCSTTSCCARRSPACWTI